MTLSYSELVTRCSQRTNHEPPFLGQAEYADWRYHLNDSFLILSDRFGSDTRDPTESELEDALRSVYIEDHPQLSEADYKEHPGAFLRFGSDEGPMFVVYVYRRGEIVLEQWADTDFEAELVAPLYLHRVSLEDALRLWNLAKDRNISSLREESWALS